MYAIVLILFFFVRTVAITRVGRIQDAIWTFNSSNSGNEYINITNATCEQCLCQLLFFTAMAQLQMDNTTVSPGDSQ